MQKIETLKLRLQVEEDAEEPKETPVPFTHEKLREILLRKIEDIKTALQKSGDYRLWAVPINGVKYAEEELSQRKTQALKQLDELKDILRRSGDQRLWMLPNQICDTVRTLVEEIRIGGDNPSEHGMIQTRLNTAEGINEHYRGLYSK